MKTDGLKREGGRGRKGQGEGGRGDTEEGTEHRGEKRGRRGKETGEKRK